jgi:hypothetical protein
VIAMLVNGPLRENDVWLLGVEQALEVLVMGAVNNGVAIDLSRENRTGFQNLAGLLRFGGPDGSALCGTAAAAETFAAIQIKQNNLMAERRIAGNRAGTTAFGVARVAAYHYHLEP